MKIKTSTIQLIAVIAIMCLPTILHAQGPGFGDDTDDVPIDGGLSLLVAAGVGYGAKKIRDKRKQQKEVVK